MPFRLDAQDDHKGAAEWLSCLELRQTVVICRIGTVRNNDSKGAGGRSANKWPVLSKKRR